MVAVVRERAATHVYAALLARADVGVSCGGVVHVAVRAPLSTYLAEAARRAVRTRIAPKASARSV